MGSFIANLFMLLGMILVLNTCFKNIRLEINFRAIEAENHRIMNEIETIEEKISATESPDFLETMARHLNMVKEGEYVIILPVEK